MNDPNPHWRPGLTSVLWGLRSFHDRCDIVRALLEGIVFDLKRCIEALPSRPKEIIVGGGLSSFPEFNQMQADILGLPVVSTEEPETTALGAAMLGAIGAELKGSIVEAATAMVRKVDSSYKFPIRENQERYAELMRRQQRVLNFALDEAERWEEHESGFIG